MLASSSTFFIKVLPPEQPVAHFVVVLKKVVVPIWNRALAVGPAVFETDGVGSKDGKAPLG